MFLAYLFLPTSAETNTTPLLKSNPFLGKYLTVSWRLPGNIVFLTASRSHPSKLSDTYPQRNQSMCTGNSLSTLPQVKTLKSLCSLHLNVNLRKDVSTIYQVCPHA